MNICLPKEKVQAFRAALKDKTLDVGELLKMSTEERTKALRDYTDSDAAAKTVNTLFESKLLLKNRTLGLQNLLSKLGEFGKNDPKTLAENKQILADFKAKQNERVFNPTEHESFLNDVADKKLGVHVSREVAQKVYELQTKANGLKDQGDSFSGQSDEYLNARNELNQYIEAQNEISVSQSISKNLAIIGRNNLLLNLSTPIKTGIGQIVNSAMDYATRRVQSLSLKAQNPELVAKANSEAWKTFRATGDNTTSMESLDDVHALGKGENFKTPTGTTVGGRVAGAIETAVRKTAQVSNKVAIDWEHNIAFTKFYQKTFFDTANVVSSDLAKTEGLTGDAAKARAADVFKDAARIEPKTAEGAMVRLRSQQAAARVTSTNETFTARLAIETKNALNKAIPGFPLGDFIIPIARIPANIIANGIENAGAGIPLGIKDIYQGHVKIQSADLATRYEGMAQYAKGIQTVARTAGTLGVAALIASRFTKNDFRTDKYANHFVKIGNTWINTEYIAAISPALAGFMYTKADAKPGQGIADKAVQYGTGALVGLRNTPGIGEANELITNITNGNPTTGAEAYAKNFFTSRGEPAFLANLLKNKAIPNLFLVPQGTDSNERTGNRLLFGSTGVESTQQVKLDSQAAAKKAAATRKANKS